MSNACSRLRRLWQINRLSPKPSAEALPTPPTFKQPTSTLNKLFKEPNLDVLASSFSQAAASSSRFREKHHIYHYTVKRLAEQKRFSSIEDILESHKKYDIIREEGFAARLMRLYGIAGMFQHAHNLFDELPDLRCPRTVMSFDALLGAANHANEFERTCEIFRDYPSKLGVKPDSISYNSVIKALGELCLIEDAISMVDEMKDSGLKPDLVTFNTVVDLAFQKRGFSEGEQVWDLMVEKTGSLVLDTRSYNSRLNGMVNDGRVLQAVNLFGELRIKGLEPDSFTYNNLIKGFCNKGDLEEAKKWYGKLVESETCFTNKTTFNVFIKPLCDNGDIDLAFDLSKRMLGRALIVDEAALQTVVDTMVKDSKHVQAEELVKLAATNYYHQYNLVMPLA